VDRRAALWAELRAIQYILVGRACDQLQELRRFEPGRARALSAALLRVVTEIDLLGGVSPASLHRMVELMRV
jgi:hypothetical protein